MAKTVLVMCPETGFSPNSKGCNCKHCLSERARWQREYRKKRPLLLRTMNLKKYGITLQEYEGKLKEQNGVCAVCHRPEQDNNQHGPMSLSVDHDHATSEVRGLLCHRCNRALGLLRDDPEIVAALLQYRKKYVQ